MAETKTNINWLRLGLKFSIPLFLFVFSLVLVAPQLLSQYSSLGAVQQPVLAKVISFVRENWPSFAWADFWQGGFPLSSIFSPVVPFLTLFLSLYSRPDGLLLRVISALAYAFIPVSLYYFVRVLSQRRLAAFLAAFLFSLMPSLLLFFFPEIKEASSPYFFAPWHFIVNSIGDTPRILSLALTPLVGAFFLKTLKKATFRKMILCSLLVALVALTDFVSYFSLLMLIFVLFFSEVLLSDKTAQSRIGIFLAVVLTSFGLISFWYHPGFLNDFFRSGAGLETGTNLLKFMPYMILVVPWLIIAVFYLFGFRKHRQSLFVALSWFSLTFIVGFSYYFFGKNILPAAPRYLVEINMSFCLMISVLAIHFFDWISRVGAPKHRLTDFFRYLFFFGVIALMLYSAFPFIRNSWRYHQSEQDRSWWHHVKTQRHGFPGLGKQVKHR